MVSAQVLGSARQQVQCPQTLLGVSFPTIALNHIGFSRFFDHLLVFFAVRCG